MNKSLKWGFLLFSTVFFVSSFVNVFFPVPFPLHLPFPFFSALPGTRSAIIKDFCFQRRVGSAENWRDAAKPVGCGASLTQTEYQLAYALAYPTVLQLENIESYSSRFRLIMTAFLNQLCIRERPLSSSVEVAIKFIDQTNGERAYLLTTSAEQRCDSRLAKFQDFKLEAI